MRKKTEETDSMELNLEDVFDEYPNPLYIVKPFIENGTSNDFEYIYVNHAFCALLGKCPELLTGKRFRQIFGPGERQWLDVFVEAATGKNHFFVDNVSTVINKKMYTEIFHVEPDMCGCIIHDFKSVPEEDAAFEKETLRQQANCDFLTGFYNRFYLNDLQDEILESENIGITFLDINNLKETNDSLGHVAGDSLIIRVSEMMKVHYKNSMIFRVGGDEFVILTRDCTREEFMQLSIEGKKLFEEDNLVAMGYEFYKKVTDLKESISQCDQLMYEHKRKMKTCH
jgi:diguanylate cyclase (GGDEF)-like protein